MPFNGLRILVTRSASQSEQFGSRLESLGAEVIYRPLIAFAPPDSWEALDSALSQLQSFHWIVFASTNAVDAFFDRFQSKHGHAEFSNYSSSDKCPKLAAIGSTTGRAVIGHGGTVDYQPDKFVAEEFVKTFPGYPSLSGLRILWPKTNIGRLHIAEALSAAGATVEIVSCYQSVVPDNVLQIGQEIAQLLVAGSLDVITLASSQTVKNLAVALDQAGSTSISSYDRLYGVPVLAIGPETAKTVRELFPNAVVWQAGEHSVDGMIAELRRRCS